MPNPLGLRWIEIDDCAGVLALEFGAQGVVLLALKRPCPTEPSTGFWLSEQGKLLGKIQVGQA